MRKMKPNTEKTMNTQTDLSGDGGLGPFDGLTALAEITDSGKWWLRGEGLARSWLSWWA